MAKKNVKQRATNQKGSKSEQRLYTREYVLTLQDWDEIHVICINGIFDQLKKEGKECHLDWCKSDQDAINHVKLVLKIYIADRVRDLVLLRLTDSWILDDFLNPVSFAEETALNIENLFKDRLDEKIESLPTLEEQNDFCLRVQQQIQWTLV